MAVFPRVKQILSPRRLNSYSMQFIKHANDCIDELNLLIDAYNDDEKTRDEKLATLYQIYLKQKKLNASLPDELMANFPDYIEQVHYKLFKNLQKHFKTLGVTSLHEETLQAALTSQPMKSDPSSLPEIIENMPPEKIRELLALLSKGGAINKWKLHNLYAFYEDGYSDYQKFLATHSISFIGEADSYGNTRNYKVTNHLTGQSLVLRAENRLDSSRIAENHLIENGLKNALVPIKAQRMGSYYSNKWNKRQGKKEGTVVRTLLVVDYIAGGDLCHQAKQLKEKQSPTQLLQEALHIYSQMAVILAEIANKGCLFLDMKNPNWLIENGILRIADTKSFSFLDDQGKYYHSNNRDKWCTPLTSRHWEPPEIRGFRESTVFDGDSVHAFMLGKNFYQFLTDATFSQVYSADEDNIDFSYPVFSGSEEGKALCSLIKDLIRTKPEDRISVNTAITRLQALRDSFDLNVARDKNIANLNKLEQYKKGYNSEQIAEIVEQGRRNIEAAEFSAIAQIPGWAAKTRQDVLMTLSLDDLKKECETILEQFQTTENSSLDLEALSFISTKSQTVKLSTNKEELIKLHDELITLFKNLQQDPLIAMLKENIEKFRKESRFYTIGMESKALRIEQALAKVPMAERCNMHLQSSEACKEVFKALAAHRHPFRSNPVNQDGTINMAKAANSYRLFHQKAVCIKPEMPVEHGVANAP